MTGTISGWRGPLALSCVFAGLFLFVGSRLMHYGGLSNDQTYRIAHAVRWVNGERGSAAPGTAMILSYEGSLLTHLSYAVFSGVGASLSIVRRLTLSLGALVVFFACLLVARNHGRWPAAAVGVMLATDPVLILTAVYEPGLTLPALFFKLTGLGMAGEWLRSRNRIWILGAGVSFGLGVWNKADFLWFVLALLPVAAYWFRTKADPRDAMWGGVGLLCGASPFIYHNVHHVLDTFRNEDLQRWGLGPHLRYLPYWLKVRASMLLTALSGADMYRLVCGPPPLVAYLGLAGQGLLLAAAGLLSWRQTQKHAGLAGAWIVVATLSFGIACLTPLPVKFAHLYVVYPIPHLLLALLLGGFVDRGLKPGVCAGLVAMLLLIVACQVSTLASFRAGMAASGGTSIYYRGAQQVQEWLESYSSAHPHARIFVDDRCAPVLYVGSGGRIRMREIIIRDPKSPERELREELGRLEPGADDLWVRYLAPFPNEGAESLFSPMPEGFPARSPSEPSSEDERGAPSLADVTLQPLLVVSYSDGRPWAAVDRIRWDKRWRR